MSILIIEEIGLVFFALPPFCVVESYSHVCVPKMYWWMIM